jgi:hypothetical protein
MHHIKINHFRNLLINLMDLTMAQIHHILKLISNKMRIR